MQYIGARYVPKFMGLYDATQAYEALCVVDNGMGTSYITKVPTPAGTPLTDTDYYAVYGASSGAIINLQNQIDAIAPNVKNLLEYHSNDIINVKDYGAKGDGTTDDYDAINDAISAAGSGGYIYFPKGTYRINSGIACTAPLNIVGDGVQSQIISYDYTKPVIEYSGTFDLASVHIENLSLTRPSKPTSAQTNAHGISFAQTTQGMILYINNVIVDKCYNGFNIAANISGGIMTNCWALGCANDGYMLSSGWYLADCFAEGVDGNGFLVNGDIRTVSGIYFVNCTAFATEQSGFLMKGAINSVNDVILLGCVCSATHYAGFRFTGSGINQTIADCFSEYAGYDSNKQNPSSDEKASGISMEDHSRINITNFTEMESAQYGIYMAGCNDAVITNAILSSNTKGGFQLIAGNRIQIQHVNANGNNVSSYGFRLVSYGVSASDIYIDDVYVGGCTVSPAFIDNALLPDVTLGRIIGHTLPITTPALVSDTVYTNNNGIDVRITISGAISAIKINGRAVYPTAFVILKQHETIQLTYAGAADWVWF